MAVIIIVTATATSTAASVTATDSKAPALNEPTENGNYRFYEEGSTRSWARITKVY